MYREGRTRVQRAALPTLTALTLAWAVHLSNAFPRFVPGIAMPLAALAVIAVAVAVVAGRLGRRTPLSGYSAALCCTLMLAVPALWSLSVFDSAYAGSSGNANAGGYTSHMHLPAALTAQTRVGGGARPAAARAFNPFNPPTTLDPAESRLLTYLDEHRDGARYLVATESWGAASPYILVDQAAVLPMGGFSGNADFPQPQQFESMVKSGEIHYVLLTGRGFHLPGADPRAAATPTTHSAARHSAATAAGSSAAADSGPSAAGMGTGAGKGLGPDLTDIATEVRAQCQLVPTADYGAVAQETAPLYHCG
jgi:hypothetical protein